MRGLLVVVVALGVILQGSLSVTTPAVYSDHVYGGRVHRLRRPAALPHRARPRPKTEASTVATPSTPKTPGGSPPPPEQGWASESSLSAPLWPLRSARGSRALPPDRPQSRLALSDAVGLLTRPKPSRSKESSKTQDKKGVCGYRLLGSDCQRWSIFFLVRGLGWVASSKPSLFSLCLSPITWWR